MRERRQASFFLKRGNHEGHVNNNMNAEMISNLDSSKAFTNKNG